MENEQLLQEVFRVFVEGAEGRFSKENLRNVYLFGSRLYGCASPNSDYDLICVVDGNYFHGSILIDNESQHKGGQYAVELEKNMINTLMCLNLPREHVWLDTYPLPACKDVLRLPALKKAVIMDASHNLAKAKRLWSEGGIRVSKKNLVHGLRYLHYALELANTGRISDFHVGNDYWRDIMECTSDDWSTYENKYRPLYMSMMHDLKYFQDNKNTEEETEGDKTGLQLLRYLRGDDIDSLARNLSIAIKQHPKHPNVVQLTADAVCSPLESKLVQECAYGIILEDRGREEEPGEKEGGTETQSKDKEWGVIAMAFPKIQYAIDPFTLNVNIKNSKKFNDDWKANPSLVEVYEKVDGSMATLYWYGDGWNVCSVKTPDGSEQLVRDKSLPKTSFEAWVISTTLNNEQEEKEKETQRSMLEEQNKKNEPRVEETFAEMFWGLWKQLGYRLPDDFGLCYIFEVVCEKQANIVRCGKRFGGEESGRCGELLLLGVFDPSECKEVGDFEGLSSRNGWAAVKRFDQLKTLEDVFVEADKLNPLVSEGFVLRVRSEDSTTTTNPIRLKVRSPQWASLSLLSWFNDPKTNERQMLDYVRKSYIISKPLRHEEDEGGSNWKARIEEAKKRELKAGVTEGHYDCAELLEYFPEWAKLMWRMKDSFEDFVVWVSEVYDKATEEAAGDKKRFALAAKSHSAFAATLFEFRDKPITRMRAYFSYCQLRKLVILMGKYETYIAKNE